MSTDSIAALKIGVAGTLRGRVVERSAPRSEQAPDGTAYFLLADALHVMRVRVAAGEVPDYGALVEVSGVLDSVGHCLLASSWRLLGQADRRGDETFEWEDPQCRRRNGLLLQRATLLARIREWARDEGLVEIEAPVLIAAPGQEPHLAPFRTRWNGPGEPQERFLATSPEYAMKRLLARGLERIYALGRVFRDGADERSRLHAPEFTMLEWYCAHCTLDDLVDQVGRLLPGCARTLTGGSVIVRDGIGCDLSAAPRRISVAEAFLQHASVDLDPYLSGDYERFLGTTGAGGGVNGESPQLRADRAYFRLLVDRIEPMLGRNAPAILHSYPARHAALSELDAVDPRLARRFELYVLGVELANAFQELRDPREQERRLEAERAPRGSEAGRFPLSQPFLRALRSGLPPVAGIAVGFDRLLYVLSDARSVHELQSIAWDES